MTRRQNPFQKRLNLPAQCRHYLIGRRFVDTALVIGACVDADDVAAGRDRVILYLYRIDWIRIRNQQPGMIERGVFRVELLALRLDIID